MTALDSVSFSAFSATCAFVFAAAAVHQTSHYCLPRAGPLELTFFLWSTAGKNTCARSMTTGAPAPPARKQEQRQTGISLWMVGGQ